MQVTLTAEQERIARTFESMGFWTLAKYYRLGIETAYAKNVRRTWGF